MKTLGDLATFSVKTDEGYVCIATFVRFGEEYFAVSEAHGLVQLKPNDWLRKNLKGRQSLTTTVFDSNMYVDWPGFLYSPVKDQVI